MTITAKIIADSISPSGKRITTYELEYPRFIHAEFMTHRLFSRNAASSRAIPVSRAIELILADTAMPIHWGKNQPGMSAKEECNELVHARLPSLEDRGLLREQAWNFARDCAITIAEQFNKAGYHKQIVNRLLEPFTHIKVVCTATEYDNFFWLRRHPDAQPEIRELADQMWQAREASVPAQLDSGDWHVPYYKTGQWVRAIIKDGKNQVVDCEQDCNFVSLQEALAISSSCCAQVSYRKLDDSLEKAQDIFKRLVESKPVHASPFEHQATPFKAPNQREVLRNCDKEQYLGATHIDMLGNYWSGNFCGWTQHRQLIDNNTCWSYDGND
jgi:Thymidylate synthase complementing protein